MTKVVYSSSSEHEPADAASRAAFALRGGAARHRPRYVFTCWTAAGLRLIVDGQIRRLNAIR